MPSCTAARSWRPAPPRISSSARATPYTKGLLGSTPRLDVVLPRLMGIDGVPPNLLVPPPGCPFEQRCSIRIDRCANEMPPLERHEHGREVACWRAFADERIEPTPRLERLPG
ncbi:MAG: hypothetical protein M5U27_00540 [Gaiella sp.]|nr:hypothetical protein [Gaiella sp.]